MRSGFKDVHHRQADPIELARVANKPQEAGVSDVEVPESADEVLALSVQPFLNATMIGAGLPAFVAVKVRSIPALGGRAVFSGLQLD
jgi:hypothetical protein